MGSASVILTEADRVAARQRPTDKAQPGRFLWLTTHAPKLDRSPARWPKSREMRADCLCVVAACGCLIRQPCRHLSKVATARIVPPRASSYKPIAKIGSRRKVDAVRWVESIMPAPPASSWRPASRPTALCARQSPSRHRARWHCCAPGRPPAPVDKRSCAGG